MPLAAGDKVFITDKTLYRTKDGEIVGEDDPRRLTKVAVPGQRMDLARAQSLGLVSANDAGEMTDTPVTGREDRITPMGGGKPADRADRVRALTPSEPATDTKAMPKPEDKAVRKTTKKRGA